MAVIEVHNLQKHYGDVVAVDGASFTVEEGVVFALLGPNGAGKTTTVEILEGHRAATGGQVSVLGFAPDQGGSAFRDRIGIVLQETGLEPALTVREAFDLYGSYYARSRPPGELIELVGLEAKATARVKTLSGGQRRRLDLALALVGDPDLLFLDEPTTGFDPAARRKAWELVGNLAEFGKTILLTTHYLDEAQYLADYIAVMSDAHIIAEGTPDALAQRAAESTISFVLPDDVGAHELPAVGVDRSVTGTHAEIASRHPTADVHQLTAWALELGYELEALSITRPSLEDIYLDIIGDGS